MFCAEMVVATSSEGSLFQCVVYCGRAQSEPHGGMKMCAETGYVS